MKFKLFSLSLLTVLLVVPSLYLGGTTGCGSGSSSGGGSDSGSESGSGGGTSTDAGEASVSSLSTVPSADISTLDYSQSSSAGLTLKSALKAKGIKVKTKKSMGEDLHAVGGASRAGCESSMHRQEVTRMSQQAQLDRCYAEAMERAGLITIPEGSYALYSIEPPEHSEEEQSQFCDGIPAEKVEEKEACESGNEGPGGGGIKLRVGIIDGELQIDMCQGESGSEQLVDEATYGADGSTYDISIIRKGTWSGREESSSFDMTIDLGADGTVTEGIVDLGTAGTAMATGRMIGGFGNGLISLAAIAAGSNNIVSGGFNGEFIDPFTNAPSSFTGKVYSQFGGSSNTGTAKFSFTGTMPPMRVSNMIPFNISIDQQGSFLDSFAAELGIAGLTVDSLLCPNPNFDPASFDNTVKPMVEANDDGTCQEVTNTGIESFSITNGTSTGDFGEEVTQTFTIIADSGSEFYDEVSVFDLSTIDPTAGSIAFSRNWDCIGAFSPLAFENFTPEQFVVIDEEMSKCFALEEKARNNGGMGDYNCHQEEQMNGVNDFSKQGGPEFGLYGGDLSRNNNHVNDTCNEQFPDHLFINSINPDQNQYCLPLEGACAEFTVTNDQSTGLNINLGGGATLTNMNFTQTGEEPATSVTMTFTTPQITCNAVYTVQQPSFDAPPEFGEGEPGQGGPEEGGTPQVCLDTFGDDVTEQECFSLCSKKGANCSQ